MFCWYAYSRGGAWTIAPSTVPCTYSMWYTEGAIALQNVFCLSDRTEADGGDICSVDDLEALHLNPISTNIVIITITIITLVTAISTKVYKYIALNPSTVRESSYHHHGAKRVSNLYQPGPFNA